MRPFNLEAALAGAPVVTRDGREVTQLVMFDCHDNLPVAGVLDGIIHLWSVEGKSGPYKFDLFMAPTKKTGWVARMADVCVSGTFSTKEEAERYRPTALSYHEITWEE